MIIYHHHILNKRLKLKKETIKKIGEICLNLAQIVIVLGFTELIIKENGQVDFLFGWFRYLWRDL